MIFSDHVNYSRIWLSRHNFLTDKFITAAFLQRFLDRLHNHSIGRGSQASWRTAHRIFVCDYEFAALLAIKRGNRKFAPVELTISATNHSLNVRVDLPSVQLDGLQVLARLIKSSISKSLAQSFAFETNRFKFFFHLTHANGPYFFAVGHGLFDKQAS